MGNAIQLFLEGRVNHYPSIEGQFIVLTQAIEALGRATVTAAYMDKEEFKKVRRVVADAIPTTVSAPHREKLESQIYFGNELSLKQRTLELLGTLEEETQRLICLSSETFVAGVVNTRNYLTHFTEKLRKKAFQDGEQILWANARMTMLLRILLLKYVGLDEALIRQRISKNWRLAQTIKRARGFPECVSSS
jgi:hypothetical protein